MILDVFDTDAFNMRSLTLAIEKLPYKPERIGQLGIFETKPQTTQHVTVEDRQGVLSLLPTLPRGVLASTTKGAVRRNMKSFLAPHVPQSDAVYAADLMGRRAFGTEDQTEVFADVVNDRLTDMKQNHEVTHEYQRLGALQGIVLDADGSTQLYNYFTDFGVSQVSVNVDFSDPGTPAAPQYAVDMKVFCQQLFRTVQLKLGATKFTGLRGFCGNKFWDNFITHGSVRRAYEFQIAGRQNDLQYRAHVPGIAAGSEFEFGDIIWENYRGGIGSVTFIPTTTAFVFPTGVRGMFLECPCPADFIETVNTPGRPIYVKQERMKFDMGIELYSESNVLYICTRPAAVIALTGINFTVTENAGLVS